MISKEVLKAFGFKKRNDKTGCFKKGSYYNSTLDIWYDSFCHSNKQFAQNIYRTVAWKAQEKLKKELEAQEKLEKELEY